MAFPKEGIWQSRHSLKVLDVSEWSTADGAPIVQWDMHRGSNQRWQIVVPAPRPTPGGPVRIDRESQPIEGWQMKVAPRAKRAHELEPGGEFPIITILGSSFETVPQE
ncbi:MAG: RICIN domain-containing protein, partial [Rubrobacteraceae bacterium]